MSQKYASCFQNVPTPLAALRSVKVLRHFPVPKFGRKPERQSNLAPVDRKFVRTDSKASEEPSTPSTRGPSSSRSHSSDMDAEDIIIPELPCLTLPGIVRRVA